MTKLLTLLVLSLLINTMAFSSEADSLYEKAQDEVQEKKYKSAIKYLEDVIELDAAPKHYVLKSYCHNQEEDFMMQKKCIENGLKKFPKSGLMHSCQANFYKLTGSFESALRSYGLAMNYAADDTLKMDFVVGRSWIKYLMQDYEGAMEDCEMAYAFDSTDIGALNNMGMICEKTGYPEKTIMYLKKVLAIDTTQVEVIGNIGFTLQNIGEYQESLQYFDQVLEYNPDEPYALSNRSYSKMKLGDLKGALEDVNRSIAIFDTNCYAYRNRGMIYIEMGKTKKACKDFEMANAYGYSRSYGREVIKLQRQYCQ